MLSNIEIYKKDLKTLIEKGYTLLNAIQYQFAEKEFLNALKEVKIDNKEEFIKSLPSFSETYQSWYSEALLVIKQVLPDRLTDFIRFYEKPKSRKEISAENYRIEDSLQGLLRTTGYEKTRIVGPEAAIPLFRQQLAIVKSINKRFESSLFDIQQLVQADLFDSELDAAQELSKKKFTRASGALAGVVLERHLSQVCESHSIICSKKTPTISDLNDFLKENNILDIPQWRFIQHLGDIRNICDHDKKVEPTTEQITDLIEGVKKIIKSVF